MLFLTFISYFPFRNVLLSFQVSTPHQSTRDFAKLTARDAQLYKMAKKHQKLNLKKSWNSTDHTNACNSLKIFEGEAHLLTGNGNAESCLEKQIQVNIFRAGFSVLEPLWDGSDHANGGTDGEGVVVDGESVVQCPYVCLSPTTVVPQRSKPDCAEFYFCCYLFEW